MSVKALVRLAKRAIRGDEWGSVEFSSTHDGNSVRVHRAIDLVPAATRVPKGRPSAALAVTEPGKISGKEKKKLRFIKHGILTRTNRWLANRAFRAPFDKWLAAGANLAPAGTSADVEMEDGGTAGPAAPPAQLPVAVAQPSAVAGASTPARASPSASAKRAHVSPGAGKKKGKK